MGPSATARAFGADRKCARAALTLTLTLALALTTTRALALTTTRALALTRTRARTRTLILFAGRSSRSRVVTSRYDSLPPFAPTPAPTAHACTCPPPPPHHHHPIITRHLPLVLRHPFIFLAEL